MKKWLTEFLSLYVVPDSVLGVVEANEELNAVEFFRGKLQQAINEYLEANDVNPFTIAEDGSQDLVVSLASNRWIIQVGLDFSLGADDPIQHGATIVDLIDYLMRKDSEIDPIDVESGFKMEAFSPNWICGPADQENIPTGGPGSSMNKNVNTGSHHFEITATRKAPFLLDTSSTIPQDIAVVIMDTPLCLKSSPLIALGDSHAEDLYKQVEASLPDSHITRNPYLPVNKPSATGPAIPPSNDVKFHSIFIAGIIKSIAPDADLYLIETLNSRGFGSLASFVWSLNAFKTLQKSALGKKRTIVNFSGLFAWPPDLILSLLGVEFLLCESQEEAFIHALMAESNVPPTIKGLLFNWLDQVQHNRNHNPDISDPDGCKTDTWKEFFDFLAYSTKIFELDEIYDLFDRDDLKASVGSVRNISEKPIMVTAAGNESAWRMKHSGIRFGATYPATIPSVVGVGALKSKMSDARADYSNEADTPASHGFWVFGGDIQSINHALDIPQPLNGVIGLCPESNNGWAEWSGTSFAAAIFSGTLAALCHAGAPRPLFELMIATKFKKTVPINQF